MTNNVSILCPSCKSILFDDIFDIDESLSQIKCKSCKSSFEANQGSLKLLNSEPAEEEYYDQKYAIFSSNEKLNPKSFRKMWFSSIYPVNRKFLHFKKASLVHNPIDFKNKTILSLGSGVSLQELYFLSLGAKLIYTDISYNAILYVKNKIDYNRFKKQISFHAIDAENIPLNGDSVDFVIGRAFVHHLDDLNPFFEEINRILKKGGLCLFSDTARSEIWQYLKFSLLKPLVNISHKKSGISPQDLKATKKGGYVKSEIKNIQEMFLFDNYIFFRSNFFSFTFERFIIKFFGKNLQSYSLLENFCPLLQKIDKYFSTKSNTFHNNTLDLFWGFKK